MFEKEELTLENGRIWALLEETLAFSTEGFLIPDKNGIILYYMPGAFTGANKEGKKGIFEAANTGTLFLDEVGEMSQAMQVALLRVLETNSIRPIASTNTVSVDVRLIMATNRNLYQLVEEGRFRKDLFCRINVFRITIPPLRDRPCDITAPAQHFLSIFNQKYYQNSAKKAFSEDLLSLLLTYSWPGNVRELRNVIEQMEEYGRGCGGNAQ
jgi:transcriptional regulator of aroF, aroG, tyrA and aromatic amino acid transport